jgi:FlaA1/EpsC-like NDP-sugar epimerase
MHESLFHVVARDQEIDLGRLLGRQPIQIDLEPVRDKISDQSLLVTGAAGSIGSELCRQLLRSQPQRLVCVDQNENGMHELQRQLVALAPSMEISFRLADITDTGMMRQILRAAEVDLIFHTAAYKHVPLVEANPSAAIKNNVLGLASLLGAAEDCGTRKFVLISTDKAVRPSSFMGCTKRLGELLLCSRPTSSLECITVRFGNVLASQGSVVPILLQQIREQGFVTLTHPAMQRFFMTAAEAVSLVLAALLVAQPRDIMVLDMGPPILIRDLAERLIHLVSDKATSVPIVFTGMRPGEKLREELFYADEYPEASEVSGVLRVRGKSVDYLTLCQGLRALEAAADAHDTSTLRKVVGELVPEFNLGQSG